MPPKKKGASKAKGKGGPILDDDFDEVEESAPTSTEPAAAPKAPGIVLGAPAPKAGGIVLGAPKSGGIVLGAPKSAGIVLGAPKAAAGDADTAPPKAPGIVLGAPKAAGIVLGGSPAPAAEAEPAAAKDFGQLLLRNYVVPTQLQAPGIVLGVPKSAGVVLGVPAAAPADGEAAAAKKKKKKKPAAAKAATQGGDAEMKEETKAEEDKKEPAAAKGKAKAKGGPSAAMRAKIAEQVRKQKEEEERLVRELEAERIREEEERKAAEEEKARKAKAAEAARQQRAAQKLIDQKKNEKERQQKAVQERLAKLGITKLPPHLQKGAAAGQEGAEAAPAEQKKKKVVYEDKNKLKKAAAEKAEQERKAEEARKAAEAAAAAAAKEDEDVPDEWDASSEEEPTADSNSELNSSSSSAPKPTAAASPAPKLATSTDSPQSSFASLSESGEESKFRSPIVCVLGHVDTGKTKLLDKIRHTNVQDGEAGGITQQIGASYFPMETLKKATAPLPEAMNGKLKFLVPGLLIIDTPGHESFTNLRARGSSLCDIAILVVDIMHGLEPQTIESIKILRQRKTPFVVALNKIDRLYMWKPCRSDKGGDEGFRKSFKQQRQEVKLEFQDRINHVIAQFAEQELNAVLYTENKDVKTFVSLVPTSAHTGEGIPDLLMLLTQLTQKFFSKKLTFQPEPEATVLEVKVIEGFGTTIDVILSQGTISEGDQIVLCGLNGPIVTSIRALLTPPPLREVRVKSNYIHHKTIRAAQGIKIAAHDLDGCVPGAQLIVVRPGDDIEKLKEEVMADLKGVMMSLEKVETGVFVQASTLGSLEALMAFLKDSNIPVAGVNIGPISKKHVVQASTMLEKKPEFSLILAFDVKINKDAADMAAKLGVQIFSADIIYHLFDQFTQHMEAVEAKKKSDNIGSAVFPVILSIFPEHIFHKQDPIVLGVHIEEGTLRVGTPICVPSKNNIVLGRVTSIQRDKQEVTKGNTGEDVAVKIEAPMTDQQFSYDRHFNHQDKLYSLVTRHSIDALKNFFKSELTPDDVRLLVKLKKTFEIA